MDALKWVERREKNRKTHASCIRPEGWTFVILPDAMLFTPRVPHIIIPDGFLFRPRSRVNTKKRLKFVLPLKSGKPEKHWEFCDKCLRHEPCPAAFFALDALQAENVKIRWADEQEPFARDDLAQFERIVRASDGEWEWIVKNDPRRTVRELEEIPGHMQRNDALRVLGIRAGASREDIQSAWKKLIVQAHPDLGGSEEKARQINEARDVLMRR